jgi:hypothetical protein
VLAQVNGEESRANSSHTTEDASNQTNNSLFIVFCSDENFLN